MAKYGPLHKHLKSKASSSWRASMTEIEAVLCFRLPPSAKRSNSWWANVSGNVQARAWLDAGWATSDVVPGGKVTFKRVNSGPTQRPTTSELQTKQTQSSQIPALPPALQRGGLRLSIDDEVLALVRRRPGLTEAEIARALFGPDGVQQRVNPTCRALAKAGAIERKGSGGIADSFTYHPSGGKVTGRS